MRLNTTFLKTSSALGCTVYLPVYNLPQAITGSGLGMLLWLISMKTMRIGAPKNTKDVNQCKSNTKEFCLHPLKF